MASDIVNQLTPTSLDLYHLAISVGLIIAAAIWAVAFVPLGWWIKDTIASLWASQKPIAKPDHWDRSIEDWGDDPDDRGLVQALASLRPLTGAASLTAPTLGSAPAPVAESAAVTRGTGQIHLGHPKITRGPVVDLAARRSAMDDRYAQRRRELDTLMRATTRQVH